MSDETVNIQEIVHTVKVQEASHAVAVKQDSLAVEVQEQKHAVNVQEEKYAVAIHEGGSTVVNFSQPQSETFDVVNETDITIEHKLNKIVRVVCIDDNNFYVEEPVVEFISMNLIRCVFDIPFSGRINVE